MFDRSSKLFKLLDSSISDWKEDRGRQNFDAAAVLELVKSKPKSFGVRYEFKKLGTAYPLHVLCALYDGGDNIELIRRAYDAYPKAASSVTEKAASTPSFVTTKSTALHLALRHNKRSTSLLPIVRFLLERVDDAVAAQTKKKSKKSFRLLECREDTRLKLCRIGGDLPLHVALDAGPDANAGVVGLILRRMDPTTLVDPATHARSRFCSDPVHPLLLAAERRCPEDVVRLLVDRNREMVEHTMKVYRGGTWSEDNFFVTALHVACARRSSLGAIGVLLEVVPHLACKATAVEKAYSRGKTVANDTPLHCAVGNGLYGIGEEKSELLPRCDIIELLARYCPSKESSTDAAAAATNPFMSCNHKLRTPLHVAANNPETPKDVMDFLLKTSPPEILNAVDIDGNTPLHLMLGRGPERMRKGNAVLQEVRKAKNKSDAEEPIGRGGLLSLAERGHPTALAIKNHEGLTPLQIIASGEDDTTQRMPPNILHALLDRADDQSLSVKDEKDNTLLHLVCRGRISIDTVKAFTERCSDQLLEWNADGFTPLHVLVYASMSVEAAEILLYYRPGCVLMPNEFGDVPSKTLWRRAIHNDNERQLQALFQRTIESHPALMKCKREQDLHDEEERRRREYNPYAGSTPTKGGDFFNKVFNSFLKFRDSAPAPPRQDAERERQLRDVYIRDWDKVGKSY